MGRTFELGSVNGSGATELFVHAELTVDDVDDFNILDGAGLGIVFGRGSVQVQGISTGTTVDAVKGLQRGSSSTLAIHGHGGDGVVARRTNDRVRTNSERTCLAKRKLEQSQGVTDTFAVSFRAAPPLSHRE